MVFCYRRLYIYPIPLVYRGKPSVMPGLCQRKAGSSLRSCFVCPKPALKGNIPVQQPCVSRWPQVAFLTSIFMGFTSKWMVYFLWWHFLLWMPIVGWGWLFSLCWQVLGSSLGLPVGWNGLLFLCRSISEHLLSVENLLEIGQYHARLICVS